MVESGGVGPPQEDRRRPSDTGCQRYASLFQDPVVEEPPRSGAPAADRQRYRQLATQAAEVCESCPLLQDCLYTAVVDHDVAGIVAGTTQRERVAIRRELGITVEPEDFDALAGVSGPNRPVDHDEVLRLHRANPREPLDTIAERLGCSLSTVKRHLRQERDRGSDTSSRRAARTQRPTPARVMAVAESITTLARSQRRAA